jgi:DtxR family Mn-dependent transcriptional regulator
LDYPRSDPHGDPIPNKDGILPQLGYVSLANMPIGKAGNLVGVAQDSAVFLQLLTKLNLRLGATLEIIEINAFDLSVSLRIDNNPPVLISHEVAKNVLVKR